MERKKFYQIIDNLSEQWYIDTVEPVTSAVRRKDGTVVKGIRLRTEAKDREGPNFTGWAQVIKWQPRKTICGDCQRVVEDQKQTIDLRTRKTKCETCDLRKVRFSGNIQTCNSKNTQV